MRRKSETDWSASIQIYSESRKTILENFQNFQEDTITNEQIKLCYQLSQEFYQQSEDLEKQYELKPAMQSQLAEENETQVKQIIELAKHWHPFVATLAGDFPRLERLIQVCFKGYDEDEELFDINTPDASGKTCLHWAVEKEHFNHQALYAGKNCPQWLMVKESFAIQALLINAGADFYREDNSKHTPYQVLPLTEEEAKTLPQSNPAEPFLNIPSSLIWEKRNEILELKTDKIYFCSKDYRAKKLSIGTNLLISMPLEGSSRFLRDKEQKKIEDALGNILSSQGRKVKVHVIPMEESEIKELSSQSKLLSLDKMLERGQEQSLLKRKVITIITEYQLNQLLPDRLALVLRGTPHDIGLVKLGNLYPEIMGHHAMDDDKDRVFTTLDESAQKLVECSRESNLFHIIFNEANKKVNLEKTFELIQAKKVIINLNQKDSYGYTLLDRVVKAHQLDSATGRFVRDNGEIIALLLQQGVRGKERNRPQSVERLHNQEDWEYAPNEEFLASHGQTSETFAAFTSSQQTSNQPSVQYEAHIQGRVDESRLRMGNVTLPSGGSHEQTTEFARFTTDRTTYNITQNFHAGAYVGNVSNETGNLNYGDRVEKETQPQQPNILSQVQVGLFSPKDSSINVRLFLRKAEQYHESLKEEKDEDIAAMREELKQLLNTSRGDIKKVSKAQRDEIRGKIKEIEEVKTAIYRLN